MDISISSYISMENTIYGYISMKNYVWLYIHANKLYSWLYIHAIWGIWAMSRLYGLFVWAIRIYISRLYGIYMYIPFNIHIYIHIYVLGLIVEGQILDLPFLFIQYVSFHNQAQWFLCPISGSYVVLSLYFA